MSFKLLSYKIDVGNSIHLDGSLKITYVLSETTLIKNKLLNLFQPNFQETYVPFEIEVYLVTTQIQLCK